MVYKSCMAMPVIGNLLDLLIVKIINAAAW